MRRHVPRILLLLLILMIVAGAALYRDQFDLALLNVWIERMGVWAPVGYLAIYALAAIAFVPGSIFGLAGGALFGPFWGTIWNLLGATLGATSAFLAARYLASDWVARKAGGHLKRLIEGVEAEGWRFVAFIRLVPLFPFNFSNYALGLTRIPLFHYVIASIAFMAPGTIAYTWLGYAGREALTGQVDAIRYGLLALGLLAAIALLPRLIGRFRGNALRWINADDLKQRLQSSEPVSVIDVREPDEFTGPLGHIQGARNMPMSTFSAETSELVGLKQAPLVLVCRTEKRSAAAARSLSTAGFADVAVLRGGMVQWNQKSLRVEDRKQM